MQAPADAGEVVNERVILSIKIDIDLDRPKQNSIYCFHRCFGKETRGRIALRVETENLRAYQHLSNC